MTPPVPVSTRAASRQATQRADNHLADVRDLLTSGLARACCYAAARPDCQVLAIVRYGPSALCAGCDQRRSALGKGTAPVRLPDPHALLETRCATPSPGPARPARPAAPGTPWPRFDINPGRQPTRPTSSRATSGSFVNQSGNFQ